MYRTLFVVVRNWIVVLWEWNNKNERRQQPAESERLAPRHQVINSVMIIMNVRLSDRQSDIGVGNLVQWRRTTNNWQVSANRDIQMCLPLQLFPSLQFKDINFKSSACFCCMLLLLLLLYFQFFSLFFLSFERFFFWRKGEGKYFAGPFWNEKKKKKLGIFF